ncbi:MAG TPA: hypothetical protein VGO40_22225 [Longimicrobium sp.]|jgi:hypothetical protein|nr:hypothetical protein [Longimicrobium sp.]
MDLVAILAVSGGILVVLVPIAGLTARFALKPLIESITEAMRVRQGGDVPAMERRVAVLEQELAGMRAELQRAADGAAFDRRLAEPADRAGS